MADWTDGYVADVPYLSGCYREQSPFHLSLAALLGNVDGKLPSPDDDIHYLELGCGKGLNALLLAAANPGWRVTAVDFNPAHIAAGRAAAQAAGLSNLRLIEAAFHDVADGSLPQADVVSMHGIWSWVSPAARADIVHVLARSVAPGGLVHVSYNSLPAWQGALGMQRLIYEAGRRAPGRSDRQVQAGLDLARELLQADAHALSTGTLPRELLEAAASHGLVDYLAHEYMNANWSPCFHADVTHAFSEAKLDYVATANLLEAFPDLMLTGAQRALHDRTDDPILRELIKDSCQPRQLRHDLFVRGARRLTNAERDAALADMTVGLTVPAETFRYELLVPAGKAAIGEAFRVYVDALKAGPMRIRDLMALTPGRSSAAEIAGMLVGTRQAQTVPRPGAPNAPSADRLNRVLSTDTRGLVGPSTSSGIAGTSLGAGLPATSMTQFVCARMLSGDDESAAQAWFEALKSNVPQDKAGPLQKAIEETLRLQVPLLRSFGILPAA